ncbi:MAG: hypothetical protein GF308_01060 [Candidatus Heimdallarchaeota archaeon]|nr:hypothetical protein [Candidatus Heimdallarchaeota archaeon]
MNTKKLFPIGFAIILSLTLFTNGLNQAATVPPTNSIILYMVCDEGTTYTIGDTVNVTVVFKNYLKLNESLENAAIKNVTIEFTTPEVLNITNVNNISPDMSTYNSTEVFADVNSTTPAYWWNATKVNVSWASFERYQVHKFWYIFNCTQAAENGVSPSRISLRYSLLNESEPIYDEDAGESLLFRINEIPTTSAIELPSRGSYKFDWWLIGGFLIGVPLIVLIIMRLTLWKR